MTPLLVVSELSKRSMVRDLHIRMVHDGHGNFQGVVSDENGVAVEAGGG